MSRALRIHWREIGLIALLSLVLLTRCDGVRATEPPLLVVIEQDAVAYTPGGQRISLPAGTELDACVGDGALLVYELGPMVMRIPQPCTERPLFADGFE